VRHNFEPGGAIHNTLSPLPGEKVISKDFANSFRETDLKSYLEKRGIKNLVICGMQTHMCVEAATRAAADMGYKCTLIQDGCATRDLQFGETVIPAAQVHASTLASLKGSYAKLLTADRFLTIYR
jgi:nicotinamidase-related amidase